MSRTTISDKVILLKVSREQRFGERRDIFWWTTCSERGRGVVLGRVVSQGRRCGPRGVAERSFRRVRDRRFGREPGKGTRCVSGEGSTRLGQRGTNETFPSHGEWRKIGFIAHVTYLSLL